MIISHFYPNPLAKKFTKYVEDYEFLENRCDKTADLIYCGSASQVMKALEAKKQFNKPIVCWVWDIACDWRDWTRTEAEFMEHKRRNGIARKFISRLRQCDKVLSGSRFTQRILKERFGISSEQLYFYIKTDEIDAVKSPFQHGGVIQISRFALNKRFDISIRAMNGIGRKFICMGTGSYSGLKSLADELHVDVDFYCKAGTPTVMGLLKGAEVLVSPSLHEGWGMTPIEAIYCGTPILLSDLEVFREIWGNNIPYHKKDDVEDMREKLKMLLADRRLQRRIIDTCRPLISEFTPWKFADRWKRAIQ